MKIRSKSYVNAVLILTDRKKIMKPRHKHRGLMLLSCFLGLVCDLIFIH